MMGPDPDDGDDGDDDEPNGNTSPVSLSSMTKAELRDYAEAKGVQGINRKMSKDEIIAKIEG